MDKYQALRRYFGHGAFREGQEALVDALLAGRDALGIMPTGGGKSLCYQVPALLLPGVTLVISPLISLMKDQVMALEKAGVPAAFLNSSLSAAERRAVYDGLRQGAYRLLYVAPERLEAENFSALARELTIPLAAVDEAHCVSQWGQDFRPSYRRIAGFLASLPRRPAVGAFTATATDLVRRDIVELLGLRDPVRVVTGFDRPNLFFDARQPRRTRASRCWSCCGSGRGAAASSTAPPGPPWRAALRGAAGARHPGHTVPRGPLRGGAAAKPGGLPVRPLPGDGGHQRLRHGHRQVQRQLCHPLQHAQERGGLLPGGWAGRTGRGEGGVRPPLLRRRRRRRRSGGRTTGGSRPSPPTAGAPGASGASCWTTSARSTASAAGTAATAWGTSAGRTSPGRRR